MDQPKLERLLKLMRLLSSNIALSVDEIAERIGTSERTVYRYLDTFKNAGFAVQKLNGEVYRLSTAKGGYKDLSKIVYFSEEEAYMVNTLIDSLDNSNALKQTLRKKLAVVYDSAHLSSYAGNPQLSVIIQGITSAIKRKKQMRIKDYKSSHSKQAKDYLVEPFELEGGFQDFWAFDLEDGKNKSFKISRVGGVEVLTEGWTAEEFHIMEPTDSFRMHSLDSYPVKLELDMVAKNLLLEEYPLAAREIKKKGDKWIYEAPVRSMEGVGRFVMGLSKHIRILEGDLLKEYVREKAQYILSDEFTEGELPKG